MDGSDSEGDPDEIVPDQDEFREEDIELVDLDEQIEDNVNRPSSPHHDGENKDSDEEENVSWKSRPGSSRRIQDSDDESGPLEHDMTFEYYDE